MFLVGDIGLGVYRAAIGMSSPAAALLGDGVFLCGWWGCFGGWLVFADADGLWGLSAWRWGVAGPLFVFGCYEFAGLGEGGPLLEVAALLAAIGGLLSGLTLLLFVAAHLCLLLNGAKVT
jgi:hypothetical protein